MPLHIETQAEFIKSVNWAKRIIQIDRQTSRGKTEGDTWTVTETERDREKHTDRHRDRETYTDNHRGIETHTDSNRDTQRDRVLFWQ